MDWFGPALQDDLDIYILLFSEALELPTLSDYLIRY